MKIALLGTRGVPAAYGGFETCAEEVGARLAERGHEVVVYCRRSDDARRVYRGMRLIHLPAARRRSLETLSHTLLSALHASASRADCAILFNGANAPLLPLIRMPVAVNIDGLEWKRGKWSARGRQYLKWAERRAVLNADRVIADARAIGDYLHDSYGVKSDYIAYGAPILDPAAVPYPRGVSVESRSFHLMVARLEPENSFDLILQGYLHANAQLPLIVIGDTPYDSPYRQYCLGLIARSDSIVHLGSVYDQDVLDWYYANCLSYLDGHTVGGTSPSLVRAMGACAAVISRDINFSHEVLGPHGRFYVTAEDIAAHLLDIEAHPDKARVLGRHLQERARTKYRWDDVADAYERLCIDMHSRKSENRP